MRVFLDCGSHEGQTLEEVTKPEWGFDVIHAFEPMPEQFERLTQKFGADDRIKMWPFGLLDRTGAANLYGDNANMAASVHPEKNDTNEDVVTPCLMKAASEFFAAHVPESAFNVLKLNCEGAETAILRDLEASGMIWRIDALMIDFDIRKVPGREHEEHEILKRLRAIHFDRFALCDDVMIGPTHQARIANWLRGVF